MTHTRTYLDQNLAFLAAHRAPSAFTAFAIAAVVQLLTWDERRRTRVALKHLDAHLLKDIGLTPTDVAKELGRPNWLP